MVWFKIVVTLVIVSLRSIYPKIVTISRVGEIRVLNRSFFSVIIVKIGESCFEIMKNTLIICVLYLSNFSLLLLLKLFRLHLNWSFVLTFYWIFCVWQGRADIYHLLNSKQWKWVIASFVLFPYSTSISPTR